MPAYVYMWEFRVEAAQRAEYERHYASNGSWARLFSGAAGYLGTSLLQDQVDPQRYLTIDRWESEAAFRAFKQRFAERYAQLDQKCEGLTISERELGVFDEAGGQPCS